LPKNRRPNARGVRQLNASLLKSLLLTIHSFWGVFWVDVSSESAAAAGFLRISNILGSSAEDIDDTRQLLSNAKGDWLLVLDNADDPDTDYERYFPSGTRGAILITSRIPECSYYNTVGSEQLGSLSTGNCLTLLLRAAEIPAESWIEHKQAANRAIDVLGSHTLALIQAGAYIAQGYCSMEEYPIQYQQQCERLLKFSLNQAQSRYLHVYATFEASAQVLESSSKETNRDALELLHLLAILHYNNLPFELFKDVWTGAQYARNIPAKTASIDKLSKWHVSQLPQFVQVDLDKWDPYRLHRAQNLLQSLALVTKGKESGSPTVSMHPLTHAWTNIRQNQVRKRQSWRATGCTLALSYYGNSAWRPYRTHLKLHLQSFLNSDSQERDTESPTMEMIRTLFQCGRLLHGLRIDSTLQDLLEKLFGELKNDPLEPVEKYLPLYRLASLNLYNMGKIKRTVEVLEKISQVEDGTLAKDHPDRLVSQHVLAEAYKANGQIKDAIQLLEHVVKVDETTLAGDHPDRLASQHALARAYKANGQIKDAVQLLEHVVKVQETTLAEDHPDRLASQHTLAQAYRANGQIKDAVQLLEHVVKVQETTLAEDHPDRLASQHALARAYRANGQIKDAVRLLEHVVKVQETTLAEDHPDRLISQHALARAYEANGQIKDAVQLLKHVVKVQETTLAEEHPDRLASQHTLAQAYEANGQIKDAIQLLEHVVKVEETTLAEDHPGRLASQHALARAYRANGQIKDAVQLLEHVAKVDETTLVDKQISSKKCHVVRQCTLCFELTLLLGAPNNESNVRQTKSRFHWGLRKGVRRLFQRSSITRS
jgi:tetratricopeptide (TPR) repeat protein